MTNLDNTVALKQLDQAHKVRLDLCLKIYAYYKGRLFPVKRQQTHLKVKYRA
jgi:hypothetical protein